MRFVPLFLFVFWGAAFAQDADPDFPPLTGRVVDAAEILSERTEERLTKRLAAWEEQSSDQIVVVTVPDLQDYTIEDYGYRLGRHWGIGQDEGEEGRALDNGALLIVAPNDRQVRIEVGYGLEGSLTDAASSIIIQQGILPAFRQGDVQRGVTEGVEGMIAALEGDITAWRDRRVRAGERPVAGTERGVPWPLIIFFLLFVLPGLMRRRRRVFFDSDRKALRRRRGYDPSGDALAWILASQLGRGGFGSHGRSGGFSGGGGFGGGFSGGGGSFGGGGASGSW